MVELVDTLDLGSSAARRGGSSPLFGTICYIKGLTGEIPARPFFVCLSGGGSTQDFPGAVISCMGSN